jgi:post-segregation antitoxin (ccd killing protein)
MGKQVRVNLTIDESVVKKAKNLGLNLSKVAENALKNMIDRIESSNFSNATKENTRMVRGVGFEPTNPYGTAASGLRL